MILTHLTPYKPYNKVFLSRCLEHYRYHELHRNVAAHVVDARVTVVGSRLHIFQPTEMTLIGTVEEVGAAEIEAGTFHAMNLQVGTGEDIK